MSLEKLIAEKTKEVFIRLWETSINEGQIQIQKTRKEFEGDLTLNVFPFLRQSKKSPEETAKALGDFFVQEVEAVESYNIIKGFLNLSISSTFWINSFFEAFDQSNFGAADTSGKTVMVEYSSPNTNKPLHLGHLRNNFLGYSVAEILKANGHQVIKTQIVNDRGIHICKSMVAWLKFGEGETPETNGLKGDHLVGKYYVAFDKAFKKEIIEVVTEKAARIELFNNVESVVELRKQIEQKSKQKAELTRLEKEQIKSLKELFNQAEKEAPIFLEAQEMLRKWEAKDEEVYALWEKMNSWVYAGFDTTYKRMGVDFDKLYYESDTFITGKEMVAEGLEKGIFYKKEDGSVWIDLTDEGMDEKLLLRSDGTAVYMTQDIGTAILRTKDYQDVSQMIYTVGNEQDYHFKVLFIILDKLGYTWAKDCYHLSYGMVELPHGKMKSREGTVVDADDLMEGMAKTAYDSGMEHGKFDEFSEEEKQQLSRVIGDGALKYFILKVDPKRKMLFNPEESVDMNGNTGPFIQYGYARICSLLRRGESIDLALAKSYTQLHEKEHELMKKILNYPAIIKDAGKNYSPAIIANYVYDLVKGFNSLYQSVSIFGDANQEAIQFRLALSAQVGKIIKSGMLLLGVDVPEKM